jgi:hypothetical protein
MHYICCLQIRFPHFICLKQFVHTHPLPTTIRPQNILQCTEQDSDMIFKWSFSYPVVYFVIIFSLCFFPIFFSFFILSEHFIHNFFIRLCFFLFLSLFFFDAPNYFFLFLFNRLFLWQLDIKVEVWKLGNQGGVLGGLVRRGSVSRRRKVWVGMRWRERVVRVYQLVTLGGVMLLLGWLATAI